MVLKVMSHTFGKTVTDCCFTIGLLSPSQGKELELIEETKRYHLDTVGVSSTKRRSSGVVEMNGRWKLFYSGA